MFPDFTDHYERAFENWLIDNKVKYTAINQSKRTEFNKSKIKSFDYLIYPPNQQTIIAEVKGKLFKGKSLENLANLECWVSVEDVDGMKNWQRMFGENHRAVFIFAYRIENIDVDFDGRRTYEYKKRKYMFFAVNLEDYTKFMKIRSPKWKTVNLPADKFRRCAVQLQSLLL